MEAIREASMKTADREVAMLGDFWHVRYAVPIELLNRVNDEFKRWSELGINTIILPGNHDQYDKHGRNALEFLGSIPNVCVYTEPRWDKHGLWMPYRQDHASIMATLNSAKPPESNNVCFAHLGIKGAWMNSNIQDEDGLEQDVFARFDQVLCGHYHRQQNVGTNITYLGSPWMTRADEAGQKKGFAHWDGQYLKRENREFGRKFHKIEVGEGQTLKLDGIKKEDRVTIQAGPGVNAESLGKQLIEEGFEDIIVKPHIEEAEARLDIESGADLHQYARKYAEQFCGDLDPNALIALFEKEIAS